MPSASSELQNKMIERFGSLDSDCPEQFLKDAGYVLTRHWFWKPKEGVTSYNQMTPEEFECLSFLIHEWDYGGFVHLNS